MKASTRQYLEGKRSAWLAKVAAIEAGDQKAISARLHQIHTDQFIGDPNSYRVCANCNHNTPPTTSTAGWDLYEDDGENFTGYWICLDCGHIQRMVGTRGDQPAELTDDQIGAISALIGKRREHVELRYQPGYDAKREAMKAERQAQAERMAEYNRLAELGYTDAQIKNAMGI